MVMTLFVLPVLYWLFVRGQDAKATQPAKAAAVAGLVLLLGLVPAAAGAQDKPLTLDECKGMAVQNNAQIQESRMDVRAAEETSKAVRTKSFPQVSASTGGLLAWSPLAQLEIQGGNLPVYDGNPANLATATQFAYFPGGSFAIGDRAFVAALTAVQPLYTGGRVANGKRLAAVGVEVATNGMVAFSDLLEAQVLRQQSQGRRIDAVVDYWLRRSAYLRSVAKG